MEKLTSILVLSAGIENTVEKKKRDCPHLCLKLVIFSNTGYFLSLKNLPDKISEILYLSLA